MDKDRFRYLAIQALVYPIRFLPYSWIHRLGKCLGSIGYYFMHEYRKRALSNLALAKDLSLTPPEIRKVAKQSFQNLAINCLEYAKFAQDKNLSETIVCENPEIANELYKKGQGILFFCGHQSNWEVLFLDGTTRMQGIAIGKSTKNKHLYRWIVSIREKFGGKIIDPRNAVKEGLRSLRKGVFLGIVGDQGMPNSGYSFPFFGRRAWTSTAPALLSYRTHSPILFASTRRTFGGYKIRYSDPIWPDLTQPIEKEIVRLMDRILTLLQESIKESPGEWLWQHNRWKQQTPQNIYKEYRHDCVCIILPEKPESLQEILPHLSTLREIYALHFLIFLAPSSLKNHLWASADEIIYYEKLEETLLIDYRFKLVFNFTNYRPIHSHYKKLSAFKVLDLAALKKLAEPKLPEHLKNDLSEILKRALCRPGTLWKNDAC